MKRFISFLALFTSASTLVCCALPALFVVLGMGAAFAGLVGAVPQLVWLSEHKGIVFGLGALMLTAGGVLQLKAKAMACPIDPKFGEACATTKDWSKPIYLSSVGIYLIGAFFAFVAPRIF